MFRSTFRRTFQYKSGIIVPDIVFEDIKININKFVSRKLHKIIIAFDNENRIISIV